MTTEKGGCAVVYLGRGQREHGVRHLGLQLVEAGLTQPYNIRKGDMTTGV